MSEIKFSTGAGNNMSIDGKKAKKSAVIIIIIIAALIFVFNCFSIVNEGFRGVKYQFGRIVQDDMTAGLNFKIPFVEEIRQVDTRNLIFPWEGDAYTKDTQRVGDLKLKLTYRYESGKLSEIIRGVGIDNVENNYLRPNVQKIAKDEIGRVNAEMLVQTRSTVQSAIQDELTRVLAPHGIIVTEFAIENIAFEAAFLDSVQAKVMAEQDALRMVNKTAERQEEARQIVIKAQADADSIEIAAAAEAKAIELIQEQLAKSPGYIEYLKITNWNGILPQVISDGVNPFVVLGASESPFSPPNNNNNNNNSQQNTD